MPSTAAALTPDGHAPAAARAHLATFLAPEVADGLVEQATLLISELVSNSVLHSRVGPGDTIRVQMDLDDERLRVTVEDAPGPFDQSASRDLGGWGLVLVERLADRWGIHRGTPNHVWFELRRNGRRDHGPTAIADDRV